VTAVDIADECRAIQDRIVAWRRAIHRRPETGLELPETMRFVERTLSSFGIAPRRVGPGVAGTLFGAGRAPGAAACIAIRADADALPIQEETGLPFSSEIPGAMHACGHDAHVAMALGAAAVLASRRESLAGAVKFIFQPGEESPGGAEPMIEAGVLDDPPVRAIVSCHVGNIFLEARAAGIIGVRSGTMTASCDNLLIRVKGRGGHGAMPHLAVDSILVASHVVTALQSLISRETKPTASGVVSIGKISGGFAANVIAPQVVMEGTIRALDPGTRAQLCHRTAEICRSVAAAMRAEAEVTISPGYPPAVNDPDVTGFLRGVAEDLFGSDRVRELSDPMMGSEDMAYFLERVPGTIFGLGTWSGDPDTQYPHHHPRFDIDESVLWMGSALFAETAVRWLERNAGG
jgi:amidohydrolase